MAPFALAEALLVGVRRPTGGALAGVLYLGLGCSLLGFLLLNYAFRFIPASRVSVFVNATPVVGVAAAYVVLGERFTAAQRAAAAVVIAGVWVANSGARGAIRSPSGG
jgi:O-acetylserine/cysteine efflux transporter